jgi:hypothetical protein
MYNSVLWGKNASVTIRNIQKLDTVVYAQVVIQENSVKFDDDDEKPLWIVREFIIFPFRNDFLMISTYVPTTKYAFTGGYFSDVNEWLLSFQLVQ